MAEMKNDPQWVPNKGEVNIPVRVKLKHGKERATGESQYGKWNLWIVEVTNGVVKNKETKVESKGYSGDAIWFPSPKVHEQLIAFTNGTKENVEIEVTKVFKESEKGPYTDYEIKVLGEGSTPTQTLNATQRLYLDNYKKFVDSKILKDTKEDFVGFGQQEIYKLSVETLNKLWEVYQETK